MLEFESIIKEIVLRKISSYSRLVKNVEQTWSKYEDPKKFVEVISPYIDRFVKTKPNFVEIRNLKNALLEGTEGVVSLRVLSDSNFKLDVKDLVY